nr:immunoglobulin heavy chain junction region [Macaca mulatta]MOW79578.1 immunoglobulin heavy chain junction region [Macaca mulatta]MOW80264.1 immunoglobulin heavy chain junction region [Macaca mulatta]MOW85576.1 immunoglobulin heavy chain junction region [Macaca mulatta]
CARTRGFLLWYFDYW